MSVARSELAVEPMSRKQIVKWIQSHQEVESSLRVLLLKALKLLEKKETPTLEEVKAALAIIGRDHLAELVYEVYQHRGRFHS